MEEKQTTAQALNGSESDHDGIHASRAWYTASNEPAMSRDAAARRCTAAPAMKRKRSLSNAMPTTLSFQELQRLNAMKMEIFGFAGWLASTLLYVLFLMWAYLPDATLRSYGLTYLPSKHWAVAVPAMIVMSYLFSIVLYKAINMKWTPTLDSYATVCDVHSVFLDDDALDAHAEAETPPMADIPLTQVNSYLFT